MEDKYAILKKLAIQKAKDELNRLTLLSFEEIEKSFIDLKLKNFEQEITIEELRHDKKKIEDLAHKYGQMLKNIHIGYVLCDKHGSILDANNTGIKLFNIPPVEKSIGRPLVLSISYEDRNRFLDWITRVFDGYCENEDSFKSINNSTLNIKGSKISKDEAIITAIDITKQQNELKLLYLIKQAIENSSDAIIITDENVHIVYANNAFVKFTGYSKQEVLGKNPSILKSGIYDKAFYEKMWEEIIKKGEWKGQIADKNKDGKLAIHQTTITAIKEKDKIINYIAIFSDITQEQLLSNKLLELTIYDPLTRLPNRQMFKNRLEELSISNISLNEGFTLLFIDLDNFKYINDTFGHSFGDELLIEVARRLRYLVRKSDLVARIGGDEFVIILEATKDIQMIQQIALNIIKTISDDIHLSLGQIVNVGCSIGIAIFPDDARNIEELVKYADIAMYKAKEEGKNKFYFYNQELSVLSHRLTKLKNLLPDAQKYQEIYLRYQPLYDAKELKIVGVEALARWYNVFFGNISPAEFIPLAEKSGQIKSLGEWIFKSACLEVAKNPYYETVIKELAINISSIQLKEPNFVKDIIDITKNSGLKPENIVLEVTETTLIENFSLTVYKLESLREAGFKVALDDFGTGYSSLNYFQKLPIDIVKIDKSFIDNIHIDKKSQSIVKTIINLASYLDKITVAEGVEFKEQVEILCELKCNILQGYYFSKPISLRNIDSIIEKSF